MYYLMTVERNDFCFCFSLIYDKVWISLFKTLLLKSELVSNIVVFGSAVVYIFEELIKVK